ncbi:hypothetical protein GCM10007416_35510 [Kroppenstedtia guangzhouensis]|uniref:Uncharacterized protein n=1 Tax=Kroppenstedtia guangzhouensis TaxID=1274356 RepID=A0ABQ1H5E8_9BACL|nr:hypothetical protein [Kroppenstedtia guangzhouensis]GGA59304.1 hypothetical protein GCM10007416_35510 [Kroppenstedtia guangzhouensis]
MLTMNSIPGNIREIAEGYKKEGEVIEVFPAKIELKSSVYYYFNYIPKNEKLLVKENGSILPVDQIEWEALVANSYNNAINVFSTVGENWKRRKTLQIYKNVQKQLHQVEPLFRGVPMEVKEAYSDYCRIPKVVIENQEIIVNNVKKALEHVKHFRETELITYEDYSYLLSLQLGLAEAGTKQNEVQMETYHSRVKVLRYLKEMKTSLFDVKTIYAIKMLKFHHKRMHTDQPRTKSEHEDMKEAYRLKEESKLPITERTGASEILNDLRNSRSR